MTSEPGWETTPVGNEVRRLAKMIGNMQGATDEQHANIQRYLNGGERLIMQDEHSLYRVYKHLIEDPQFRLAVTAIMAATMPEGFLNAPNDNMIVMLSYMIATVVAATED